MRESCHCFASKTPSLSRASRAPDILKRGLIMIMRPRSPMHGNLSAVLSRSTVSQNEALRSPSRESLSILVPPWRVPIRGGAPSHGDLWLLAPVATQPKRIARSLAAHGRDQQPAGGLALNKRPARRAKTKISLLNGFWSNKSSGNRTGLHPSRCKTTHTCIHCNFFYHLRNGFVLITGCCVEVFILSPSSSSMHRRSTCCCCRRCQNWCARSDHAHACMEFKSGVRRG